MFDLSRLGLPKVIEAHGKKWIAVYYVSSDDDGMFWIATEQTAEGRAALPAQTFIVHELYDEEERERRRKAKEKKDAPSP